MPAPSVPSVPTRLADATQPFALALCASAAIIVGVGRLGELFPLVGKVPLVKLFLGAAIALALVYRTRLSINAIKASRLARIVCWLFLLSAVSVLFSVWKPVSLLFVWQVVSVLALFFIFIFMTGRSRRALQAYINALRWSGALLVVVLLSTGSTFADTTRAAIVRTSYDPNDLAFVVTATIPLMWSRVVGQRGVLRYAWGALTAASVWAVLLTQSRGGLLALICVALFLRTSGVSLPRERSPARRYAAQRIKSRVIVSILVMALASAMVWNLLPEEARGRFASLTNLSADYNVTYESGGRFGIWKRGLKAMVVRPWGAGVGAFPVAEGMQGGQWRAAHNMYIQLGTELGLLGLILFMTAWRIAWVDLRKSASHMASQARSQDEFRHALDIRMLRGSIVGVLVGGIFLSMAYSILLFVILAIAAAAAANVDRTEREPLIEIGVPQRQVLAKRIGQSEQTSIVTSRVTDRRL